MEPVDKDAQTQVFVVRYWWVSGADGGWRGQVQHVPSGERSPIRDPLELQAFIERRLEAAHQDR